MQSAVFRWWFDSLKEKDDPNHPAPSWEVTTIRSYLKAWRKLPPSVCDKRQSVIEISEETGLRMNSVRLWFDQSKTLIFSGDQFRVGCALELKDMNYSNSIYGYIYYEEVPKQQRSLCPSLYLLHYRVQVWCSFLKSCVSCTPEEGHRIDVRKTFSFSLQFVGFGTLPAFFTAPGGLYNFFLLLIHNFIIQKW